jgi:hypothetical protein
MIAFCADGQRFSQCRPTQRAPDVWESARFLAFFLAGGWFREIGLISTRPAAGNASRWAAR